MLSSDIRTKKALDDELKKTLEEGARRTFDEQRSCESDGREEEAERADALLKAIRKRISSVKSTQKITRAMKMVAGARLNRAQQRITALRPYAVKTHEVLE